MSSSTSKPQTLTKEALLTRIIESCSRPGKSVLRIMNNEDGTLDLFTPAAYLGNFEVPSKDQISSLPSTQSSNSNGSKEKELIHQNFVSMIQCLESMSDSVTDGEIATLTRYADGMVSVLKHLSSNLSSKAAFVRAKSRVTGLQNTDAATQTTPSKSSFTRESSF